MTSTAMLPLPDVVHPSPLPALRAADFPHLRFFGLHNLASALSFVPLPCCASGRWPMGGTHGEGLETARDQVNSCRRGS